MNEVLKTIDALPDGRTVFYAPKSRDEPFANMTTDDLKKLAALVPKWTRVEDGLPESNGPYLFTFAFHAVADDMIGKPGSDNPYYADGKRFGGPRVVEELYYADGKWYPSHDDYHDEPENGMSFDNSQYIAWMPLPQPFTEEQDEQR